MDLPSASTRLDDNTAPSILASKLLCVIAPVATNANAVPWIVGNPDAMYDEHGYSPALDFVADFIDGTKLPVLLVPIPIVTPGVVGRFDTSGNTNTSVVSVAVGAYGSLEEVEGRVRVNRGGVVGTDQIVIDLSLDGGVSYQEGIRVGTASTYTIPYIGQTLSFAGGSLTAGETVLAWTSTAPLWGSAGIAAARTALASQLKQTRTWLVIGDVSTAVQAGYVNTAVNSYETAKERYTLAKLSLRDRLPAATLSQTQNRMTGAPNVTFAEVGAGNDTAVRSAGSFIADGFVNGDTVRITGAVAGGGHNNIVGVATVTNATTLTFAAAGDDLDAEGPIAGVAMTAEATLTFVDGGAGDDTLTRNRGSFIADGFRIGDVITVTGTVSNDGDYTLTNVAALTLTVATASFAAEVIGSYGVTITAGETDAEHIAALEAEMAAVTGKRIDLGVGRARRLSPYTGAMLRRSVQWADTIRAYQHDVHIATWQKDLGDLVGWSLLDADGNVAEHDEDEAKNALPAGFTCFRTWPNGPEGTFIARSVTRHTPGKPLSSTENAVTANLAQTVTQLAAERALGRNLVLDSSNRGSPEAIEMVKAAVDGDLAANMLADMGEGPRASEAYWTPATDDDLSGVDATLNATGTLRVNGKLVHIATSIRVNPGA